jgi:putative transcriptional regulator
MIRAWAVTDDVGIPAVFAELAQAKKCLKHWKAGCPSAKVRLVELIESTKPIKAQSVPRIESEPFHVYIYRMRSQLGMTQEELAHYLAVAFATVNRWENNRYVPTTIKQEHYRKMLSEKRKEKKP